MQKQLELHSDIQSFDGGHLEADVGLRTEHHHGTNRHRRFEFHLIDFFCKQSPEYEKLFRYHCGTNPSFNLLSDFDGILSTLEKPVALFKSTRLIMQADNWELFEHWVKASKRQVYLLGIVRFPFDSLSSDADVFQITGKPSELQQQWVEAYKRFNDAKRFVDSTMLVRLEDIVTEPAQAMRAVTDWLELKPLDNILEWKPLHQHRWKSDPIYANCTTNPELKNLSERFGYSFKD